MGLTLKLVCMLSVGDNGEVECFCAMVRITLQIGVRWYCDPHIKMTHGSIYHNGKMIPHSKVTHPFFYLMCFCHILVIDHTHYIL